MDDRTSTSAKTPVTHAINKNVKNAFFHTWQKNDTFTFQVQVATVRRMGVVRTVCCQASATVRQVISQSIVAPEPIVSET
jgi:hypothetical protein